MLSIGMGMATVVISMWWVVLYCIVLYCIVLYCIVLFYSQEEMAGTYLRIVSY